MAKEKNDKPSSPKVETRPNTTSSVRTFSKTEKTSNNTKNKKSND